MNHAIWIVVIATILWCSGTATAQSPNYDYGGMIIKRPLPNSVQIEGTGIIFEVGCVNEYLPLNYAGCIQGFAYFIYSNATNQPVPLEFINGRPVDPTHTQSVGALYWHDANFCPPSGTTGTHTIVSNHLVPGLYYVRAAYHRYPSSPWVTYSERFYFTVKAADPNPNLPPAGASCAAPDPSVAPSTDHVTSLCNFPIDNGTSCTIACEAGYKVVGTQYLCSNGVLTGSPTCQINYDYGGMIIKRPLPNSVQIEGTGIIFEVGCVNEYLPLNYAGCIQGFAYFIYSNATNQPVPLEFINGRPVDPTHTQSVGALYWHDANFCPPSGTTGTHTIVSNHLVPGLYYVRAAYHRYPSSPWVTYSERFYFTVKASNTPSLPSSTGPGGDVSFKYRLKVIIYTFLTFSDFLKNEEFIRGQTLRDLVAAGVPAHRIINLLFYAVRDSILSSAHRSRSVTKASSIEYLAIQFTIFSPDDFLSPVESSNEEIAASLTSQLANSASLLRKGVVTSYASDINSETQLACSDGEYRQSCLSSGDTKLAGWVIGLIAVTAFLIVLLMSLLFVYLVRRRDSKAISQTPMNVHPECPKQAPTGWITSVVQDTNQIPTHPDPVMVSCTDAAPPPYAPSPLNGDRVIIYMQPQQ